MTPPTTLCGQHVSTRVELYRHRLHEGAGHGEGVCMAIMRPLNGRRYSQRHHHYLTSTPRSRIHGACGDHHGRCFTRTPLRRLSPGKVGYFDMAQLSSPLTTSALCSLFSHLLPRSGIIALRPDRRTHCRPHYLRAVRPFSTTRQALLMPSSGEGDPLLGRLCSSNQEPNN
jgi:hypothetical protein